MFLLDLIANQYYHLRQRQRRLAHMLSAQNEKCKHMDQTNATILHESIDYYTCFLLFLSFFFHFFFVRLFVSLPLLGETYSLMQTNINKYCNRNNNNNNIGVKRGKQRTKLYRLGWYGQHLHIDGSSLKYTFANAAKRLDENADCV